MIDNKVEEIRKHFEKIIDILEIERDGNTESTALRISKMYCNEVFANRNNYNINDLNARMKVFDCENPNEMIEIDEAPVYSMCSHHFMPFYGTCKVSYIPDKKIIGLSKIPRVVKFFSKKPQLQENLTKEIGEYLVGIIDPKYLAVEVVCEHTCVSVRGAESPCKTKTYYHFGE